jgi:hypothetical protein
VRERFTACLRNVSLRATDAAASSRKAASNCEIDCLIRMSGRKAT